jgi:predicted DsbA family dithiol-disulfide isomerase
VPFFVIGRYGISGAQSREGMKAAIAKALEEQEAEILQAGSGMTCGPEGCRIG